MLQPWAHPACDGVRWHSLLDAPPLITPSTWGAATRRRETIDSKWYHTLDSALIAFVALVGVKRYNDILLFVFFLERGIYPPFLFQIVDNLLLP